MKSKILWFGIMLFAFMGSVSAVEKYYYINANNEYVLCKDNNCIVYEREQVNENNGVVSLSPGDDYYINQSKNPNQVNSQQKYYYINSDNEYVLCNENNNCVVYKREQINVLQNGAVALGPGDEYVLDQTKDPRYVASNTESGSNNTGSSAKTDYCTRLKEPLKFIGRIVTIFKIIIPLVLIAFGMVDFFRSVTSGKPEEISKSAKSFLFRVLAGIIIFFLPMIISLVFSLVDSWADVEGDFNACQKCIFRVSRCE